MTINTELSQIESSDYLPIKALLTSEFRNFIDIDKEMTLKNIDEYISSLNSENSYCFAIKIFKDSEYKRLTIGLCGISNIDWINSNGVIMFLMADKGGYSATLQDHAPSKNAFYELLNFGFNTLNLHKLSIEVFHGNDVMGVLEEFGFVAEGVRRSSRYKGGQFIDTTVCSIVAQEFKKQ